jgi:LPS O-antigen subunit length determinant protein (WzzB/FepE family)
MDGKEKIIKKSISMTPDIDRINVIELIKTAWSGRKIVSIVTAVFAVISVLYALSLSNIYESTARLGPVDDSSTILSGLQQYAGLSQLAGISLNAGNDKVDYAIEILESRHFLNRLIQKHEMLVPLMAAKRWNSEANQLEIDSKDYNVDLKKWVRKTIPPYQSKPSLEEAYIVWQKLFAIDYDGAFLTLTLKHKSPALAQQWLLAVVDELNSYMKDHDVKEAERSIAYLKREIERTAVAQSQSLLFDLIQSQTETIMLANIRDEYVFRTIDPPLMPIKKVEPSRSILCIAITLLGFVLALFFVIARAKITAFFRAF